MGRLVSALEPLLRRWFANLRFAGIMLLSLTTACSAGAAWLLLTGAAWISPLAGSLAGIFLSSTCLAARSLHRESSRVAAALAEGNLVQARERLAWIVGRDTAGLDEPEIWRALVETVAENTSDGIIAPLFWLSLGGPAAAVCFKAISTLDSMVGYRNDRYIHMGWASARADDVANLLPARLTALLMIAAAPLTGLSWRNALKIVLRDRLKHPSPNSAHPEAAAAGALGVRLGGPSRYGGKESFKEHIGDPLHPLDRRAYDGMIRLMYATTLLMAGICVAGTAAWKG